jgi:hypothetical protein
MNGDIQIAVPLSPVQERSLSSISPSASEQDIYGAVSSPLRKFEAQNKFFDDDAEQLTNLSRRMNGKTAWQQLRGRDQHIRKDDSGDPLVPFLRNRHEKRAWRAQRRRTIAKAILLNKWQGMIQEVFQDRFRANLFDLNHDNVFETAEFSFSEVAADDRSLIREGAVFYWYILYLDSETGDRDRVSRIWFRRSGRMSKDEYSRALERVSDVWRSFGWEGNSGDASGKRST